MLVVVVVFFVTEQEDFHIIEGMDAFQQLSPMEQETLSSDNAEEENFSISCGTISSYCDSTTTPTSGTANDPQIPTTMLIGESGNTKRKSIGENIFLGKYSALKVRCLSGVPK